MKFGNALTIGLLMASYAPFVLAQHTPAKLEWPRSFSGQPDFAFTRDEAQAEARARAARENTSAPKLPTLYDVATDEDAPDPLGLKVVSISPTLSATGEEISATAAVAGVSLLDKLLGNMSGLPSYATPTTTDLGEYRASVQQLISATIAGWQPDANRYDFSSVLSNLTLQAVVTSPQQYAVINGTRYEVGSSFILRVPLTVPDSEILAALDATLPEDGTLDAATMAAYRAVAEEAIAAFAAARSANAVVGQQVLNIPVSIQAIEPRRVMLLLNGQPHPLGVRYAY